MTAPIHHSRPRVAGFTMPEMLIVCVLFVLLVGAFVATQLFAARIYTLAATKLTATAAARQAMNDLRDKIKGAQAVQVGIYNVTNNTYSLIPDGTLQLGNALLLSSTNQFVTNMERGTVYFMNRSESNLCTVVLSNGSVLTSTLITNIIVYITNYNVFDAEDVYTNIYTNYTDSRVIHVFLQFSQWEYPVAGVVGQGAMYDYYQLQTRVAKRIPQPTI